MSTTIEKIKNIITIKLGIKAEKLDENKPMKEFGLDSLSQAELLFMIEDQFSVSVPDAQARVNILKELADVIDLLIAQKDKAV
jgi:acyl carrier protein